MTTRSKSGPALISLILLCLTACGGTKILKEPLALTVEHPLTVSSDQTTHAQLDWVIFRDGPGTWARNADWDEYMLRIVNQSDHPISIIDVVVFDSLETPLQSTGNRKHLVKGSRQTVRRYKDQDLQVKAGLSGTALAALGAGSYVAGLSAGVAVLGSTASAAAAGTAAVGAIVLAPVLIVGGMVRGIRSAEVAKEISRRQIEFPTNIEAGAELGITCFFPIAPSPQRIDIRYKDGAGEHTLSLNTVDVLAGLHIDSGVDGANERLN